MPEQTQQSSTSSEGLAAQARQTTERLEQGAVQQAQRVRQTANEKKAELAERVRRVGSAVRETGERLRDEDRVVGRYADIAAERIERAARYIGDADPRAALQDIERFARRRPAVFFGGAFLVGLALGRFFKSSRGGATTRGRGETYDSEEGRYFEQSGYLGGQYGSQRAGLRFQEGIETSEVAGHGATQAGAYPAEKLETPNPNPQKGSP